MSTVSMSSSLITQRIVIIIIIDYCYCIKHFLLFFFFKFVYFCVNNLINVIRRYICYRKIDHNFVFNEHTTFYKKKKKMKML